MPRVFRSKGFRLHHKEQNSKYMGFTYSLNEESHREYVLDIAPRLGILIKTKGTSGQRLVRLHDILFLVNTVTASQQD
jgi:hypothetical protein